MRGCLVDVMGLLGYPCNRSSQCRCSRGRAVNDTLRRRRVARAPAVVLARLSGGNEELVARLFAGGGDFEHPGDLALGHEGDPWPELRP